MHSRTVEIDSRWATGGLSPQRSGRDRQACYIQGTFNLLQKWCSCQSPWQPRGMQIALINNRIECNIKSIDSIFSCLFCSTQTCFLLDGLFPLISALCEEKLDCHYYVFQGMICHVWWCRSHIWAVLCGDRYIACLAAFTIWLKRVKECLREIWDVTGAPLDSNLQRQLTQIIWSNAESPVSLLCYPE